MIHISIQTKNRDTVSRGDTHPYLKGIEHSVSSSNGCSEDTFIHLYKTLVFLVMDYLIAAISTATDLASKEFSQVLRSALLKATGCLPNVSL